MKYDVVVVGGGPAGLSSAIYTARVDFETLVLDRENEMSDESITIENLFGFPSAVTREELLERGRRQAEKFGAQIKKEEALLIEAENKNYKVEAKGNNPIRFLVNQKIVTETSQSQ